MTLTITPMNATIKNPMIKNMLLCAVVLLMMFSFTPSYLKAKFAVSKIVPAARGDVKVTKDEANRYTVKIRVSDLARVEGLQSSKRIYVVWLGSN
jgi:hypothetical protein